MNEETHPPAVLDSVRELLRRTFAFYREHWRPFFVVGIISLLPTVLEIGMTGTVSENPGLLVQTFQTILSVVLYATLLVIVIDGTVSFSKLNTRAGSYLYVTTVSLLAGVSPVVFLLIAALLVVTVGPTFPALIPIAVTIGVILFVVCAVYLFTCFGYSVYLIFTEDKRGAGAVAASWFYVEGLFWEIFGRYILFWLLLAVINIAISIPFLFAGTAIASLFATFFQYFFSTPITLRYSYEIYKNLRTAKHDDPLRADREAVLRKRAVALAIIGLVAFPTTLVVGTVMLEGYAAIHPYTVQVKLDPANVLSSVRAYIGAH